MITQQYAERENAEMGMIQSFVIFCLFAFFILQQIDNTGNIPLIQLITTMSNLEQLNEARQKYLDSMNRVNLLLLKEHDLRRNQKTYADELEKVEDLIKNIKSGRKENLNILAQDRFLRNRIKENEKQIQRLTRKMQGEQLFQYANTLKQEQEKYREMMSQDFQITIQHKLANIRGKVDELKKKIKEINKQTLNYEQEHQEVLDNYSFNMKILNTYKNKNVELQQKIAEMKKKIGS